MRRRIGACVLMMLVVLTGGLVVVPGFAQSSLQELVDAAAPGSTVDVPAGTYAGPVRIEKPLTLIGAGSPVVDGGGDGDVFYVSAPDVTIEGFVIRNTGDSLDRENAGVSSDMSPGLTVVNNTFEDVLFGVFARNSPETVVAGNRIGAKNLELGRRGDGIRLWESPNSLVEGNTVTGGRDMVLWFADGVVVRDNVVSGGRYGLHFMYSDGAFVERNHLFDNSVGMFLMYSLDPTVRDNVLEDNYGPSGYGIGLKDVDGAVATGNRFLGNRVGLYLDNSPSAAGVTQRFESNVFAYNRTGVVFLPSVRNNTFTGNAFVDNGEHVGVQGSGSFTGNTWTADGQGNFWSDYAGYDADGDGTGDIVYVAADLFSELTDDHPELRFFVETPAARAVDVAASMFPVFRPRPKLEDTAPLISPGNFGPAVGGAGEASALGAVLAGAGLVAVSAALFAAASMSGRSRP